MTEYRYILEPYKSPASRIKCPSCGEKRVFTAYIDTHTGKRLPAKYGRCDRSVNCGYFVNPYTDHYTPDVGNVANVAVTITTITNEFSKPLYKTPALPTQSTLNTFIPDETFQKSLARYTGNNFITYLTRILGPSIASKLANEYKIGTARYWPGSTVFWQVDETGNVRTGKIMLYDPVTGRRVKDKKATWAHYVKAYENFRLSQCFFGLHLLNQYPDKPIAIVESEKTAIIASAYLPKFIWLASGGKEGLSDKKIEELKGRGVCLYPDLNAYDYWNKKAIKYGLKISDLLERKATTEEKKKGWDLADFLINQDSSGLAMSYEGYPMMWDYK